MTLKGPERSAESSGSFSVVPSPVVSAASTGSFEKPDQERGAAAAAGALEALPALASAAAASVGGHKVAQMISHLERVNTNPQQMWMDALKEYKEIDPA